jgi:cellulose synthase/poly-beta-1,6-N-acetylglucosamine synthase-like glycosyltransferase
MYNEEKVIKEKIKNTSLLNYPKEKLEILLLDDHSTDKSTNISEKTIEELSLNARVVSNLGGKGKARALNWIFPSIKSEITLISDADALLEKNSLHNIVQNFMDQRVGGATGKIVIVADKDRISKSQEDSYRFYFDIWRLGESNIQSVSVCNGPIMAFRTELLKKVIIDPDIYADDSDILFKIIRQGYRVIYEPKAIAFERVPLSIKGRSIQKMKRINGLRTVYLTNLDLIGKGKFGKVIYPYALLTHIVSPAIILLLTVIYPVVVVKNPVYLGLLIFLLVPKIGKTVISFITTQLMINFSFIIPTAGSWEAVEDARYELNNN